MWDVQSAETKTTSNPLPRKKHANAIFITLKVQKAMRTRPRNKKAHLTNTPTKPRKKRHTPALLYIHTYEPLKTCQLQPKMQGDAHSAGKKKKKLTPNQTPQKTTHANSTTHIRTLKTHQLQPKIARGCTLGRETKKHTYYYN